MQLCEYAINFYSLSTTWTFIKHQLFETQNLQPYNGFIKLNKSFMLISDMHKDQRCEDPIRYFFSTIIVTFKK